MTSKLVDRDACTICGNPPSQHNGLEKYCQIYATYRAPEPGLSDRELAPLAARLLRYAENAEAHDYDHVFVEDLHAAAGLLAVEMPVTKAAIEDVILALERVRGAELADYDREAYSAVHRAETLLKTLARARTSPSPVAGGDARLLEECEAQHETIVRLTAVLNRARQAMLRGGDLNACVTEIDREALATRTEPPQGIGEKVWAELERRDDTPLPADKLAERVADLELALDLALGWLAPNEPPDSRAVSNEFVAMAAIQYGSTERLDECRDIIRTALLALTAESPKPEPAPLKDTFPPSCCTAFEDCRHDGVCHDLDECGAKCPNS